jgi:hypothetical protein
VALAGNAVTEADAFHDALVEEAFHGVARADGIAGEFVTEVFEREGEPLRYIAGALHRMRQVVKEGTHLLRRSQVAARIDGEQTTGVRQRFAIADAGEDVEDLAVVLRGVAHAVGGDHGKMERRGDAQRCLVAPLLFPLLVALELDVYIVAAIDGDQPINSRAALRLTATRERCRERTLVAAGKADQSAGELLQIVDAGRAFGFGQLTHLVARDHLAEVLVASTRGAEQRKSHGLRRAHVAGRLTHPWRGGELIAQLAYGDLCADVAFDLELLCHGVEARRPVEAVAIGEGHRGHFERDGLLSQRLGLRCALEEGEGAGGMQLDIGISPPCISHRYLPNAMPGLPGRAPARRASGQARSRPAG